jgi:hypothetical protein
VLSRSSETSVPATEFLSLSVLTRAQRDPYSARLAYSGNPASVAPAGHEQRSPARTPSLELVSNSNRGFGEVCVPVQAVQSVHTESRRVVEDSPILRSQEDSMLESEVSAAAVKIPCPSLRARSRCASRIEYQSARARQHKRRPTLRREPEYVCREHLIGIVIYSKRPVVQAIGLSVSRVAIA